MDLVPLILSDLGFSFFHSFILKSGVIPIGGAHIEPTKPLPNDLKNFLDNAENGAIYFSLGSVVQSSQLPKEWTEAFLSMLSE